jgi:hypothetical protein
VCCLVAGGWERAKGSPQYEKLDRGLCFEYPETSCDPEEPEGKESF